MIGQDGLVRRAAEALVLMAVLAACEVADVSVYFPAASGSPGGVMSACYALAVARDRVQRVGDAVLVVPLAETSAGDAVASACGEWTCAGVFAIAPGGAVELAVELYVGGTDTLRGVYHPCPPEERGTGRDDERWACCIGKVE